MNSHLKDWRKATGMSGSACAALLGVDKATISRWESQRIRAEMVMTVYNITHIHPHLLRPDVFPKSYPTLGE